MKELNDLVELANFTNISPNGFDKGKMLSVHPETILAIAEAFRALEQRAEAAEAKVEELEQQDPVAFRIDPGEGPSTLTFMSPEEVRSLGYVGGIVSLYARPAPAVSLAELVPNERPVKEDEFLSEYLPQQPHYKEIFNRGFKACRAAILHNIEEKSK